MKIEETTGKILSPTMKLRWSKSMYYDGMLGEFYRPLQQCFIDQEGNEHWKEIEVEKNDTKPNQ